MGIMNTSIRSLSVRLLAVLCGLVVVNIILSFRMEQMDCDINCVNRTELLNYLIQFQRDVHKENVPQQLRTKLEEIIDFSKSDDWGNEPSQIICKGKNCAYEKVTGNVNKTLDVCPEKWTGRGDNLYYLDTWKTKECKDAIPFTRVLSVLLNPSSSKVDCSQQISPVLKGLQKVYGKLPVLVANVNNFCANSTLPTHVQFVTIENHRSNPGQIWNTLVNAATTPYVLIGRDVDNFMWFSNLQRPVRVLSNSHTVKIAGGAIRNQTGHWRVGCHQTSLSNYILQYQDGYYSSKHDCMFCGHLLGPFVSRTLFLKHNPFNDLLPEEVFFEDFFLQIKQSHHSVVNCPDVMYFSSDPMLERKLLDRKVWLPLVRKWELNRIVVASNRVFSYSCSESGLKCNLAGLVESFLMPICCVDQFARAVGFIDKFCRHHKISYEFAGGTVMGIIKMGGIMPWDHDGDLFYLGNYSIFDKHKSEFTEHGVRVGRLTIVKDEYRWTYLTPDINIDMSGCVQMSYDSLSDKMFRETPTQAQLHGYWVYVMPNPGGYSRNNYGYETLKHAHHFHSIRQKFAAPYKGGHFKQCKKPQHHACLDHFSADGGLQFYVPK